MEIKYYVLHSLILCGNIDVREMINMFVSPNKEVVTTMLANGSKVTIEIGRSYADVHKRDPITQELLAGELHSIRNIMDDLVRALEYKDRQISDLKSTLPKNVHQLFLTMDNERTHRQNLQEELRRVREDQKRRALATIVTHKSIVAMLDLSLSALDGAIQKQGEYDHNGVYAWQICECDTVAARTLEDALAYYQDQTGVTDDELYTIDDIEALRMDGIYSVSSDDPNEQPKNATLREMLESEWKGSPYIIMSTEV